MVRQKDRFPVLHEKYYIYLQPHLQASVAEKYLKILVRIDFKQPAQLSVHLRRSKMWAV